MKTQRLLQNLLSSILTGCWLALAAHGQSTVVKTTQTLLLGETQVKINVYVKEGSRITFFAPHYNEQIGTKIVKDTLEKKGGRLIEVESVSETGSPARHLTFISQTKSYSLDPNRIFTDNGRICSQFSPEIAPLVKTFADELLKIIFAPNGTALRSEEKFLVAVHNNADYGEKTETDRGRDLTANSFIRNNLTGFNSISSFYEQADGVFISNVEVDPDNFYFLSTPEYLGFFAGKGFNAVVQKSAQKLLSTNCSIDDGSLSVFSGQHNIQYINIEADVISGSFRQKQMIEAVYELRQKIGQSGSDLSGEVTK